MVSHRRCREGAGSGRFHLSWTSRPHDQTARLSRRARRDRGCAQQSSRRDRGGGHCTFRFRRATERGSISGLERARRAVCPAAEEILHRRAAKLHGPGQVQVPAVAAKDLHGQGRLPEAQRVRVMDFSLSAEEVELRDRIVRFVQKELSTGAVDRDRAHEFPRDLWDKCGRMGLTGLPVPETYGGSGLSPVSCAVALEALGYGCTDGGLAFSICAHLLACVVPIWKHGDEAMKRRYLPDLCA